MPPPDWSDFESIGQPAQSQGALISVNRDNWDSRGFFSLPFLIFSISLCFKPIEKLLRFDLLNTYVQLSSKWMTTKMEDDTNGRQPEWKTTKMEDDQNER